MLKKRWYLGSAREEETSKSPSKLQQNEEREDFLLYNKYIMKCPDEMFQHSDPLLTLTLIMNKLTAASANLPSCAAPQRTSIRIQQAIDGVGFIIRPLRPFLDSLCI